MNSTGDTLTAEQRLGQFEEHQLQSANKSLRQALLEEKKLRQEYGGSLPALLNQWQARHKVQSLAAAGRLLGVPYRTMQSWARGERCPRGLGLRLILERLEQ